MKGTYYSIIDLVTQPDFSERKAMTEINVKTLGLGPRQSRKYFEAVAILHRKMLEGKLVNATEPEEMLLLKYYHKSKGA